jgi:hypothetical protein
VAKVEQPAAEAKLSAAEAKLSAAEAKLSAKPIVELKAEPTNETEILLRGFGDAISLVGIWKIEGDTATQTDPEAFFAKLATPLVQEKRGYSYSFVAKSNAKGRGWVGVGLHIFTPASYTQKGYGAGDSICVWLTRDPVHFSSDTTRLQLYRSTDDWNMDLIGEVPVPESIYDANRFDIGIDPATGNLSVSMNGTQRLKAEHILDLHKGLYVVFRSLDTAEFSAFSAGTTK